MIFHPMETCHEIHPSPCICFDVGCLACKPRICTVEANQFADATDEFAGYGATVVGMSADDIDKLAKFSTSECRSKFAVASASSKTIAAYDAKLIFGKSNRTSYLISPQGKVLAAYSDMDYRGHVPAMLKAAKAWHHAQK